MQEVPKRVATTFSKLKAESKEYLVLKTIHSKYYVYKERGVWLRDMHRTKTISEYIGKISANGLYIKKKLSAKDDLENAVNLISIHGGKIIWHESREMCEEIQAKQPPISKGADLKLLMALSMNSRLSSSELASLTGLSEKAAYSRMKVLERDLGIDYILEIDIERLGYAPYLLLVKFEDNAPAANDVKNAFVNEPKIQFTATTKGEYDLVAYLLDVNYVSAIDNFRALILKTSLAKYRAKWNLIPFAQTYSFMPLRKEFIENVLKTKRWRRDRESTSPKQDELLNREFIVLKELNTNSIESFSRIDEKYGLNKGTSRYAYSKLKAQGIIVRPTISIANLHMKYIGIIQIMDIGEKAVEENRYKSLFDLMEYGKLTNKYCLSGNIGMPDGAMRFLPVFNDGDIDKVTKTIEKELTGSSVRNFIVTDILVGSLCYRRFDNDYSRQHRLLTELGKVEAKKPASYR
jgi:DNA-binding Lrp family transcriptional regulator